MPKKRKADVPKTKPKAAPTPTMKALFEGITLEAPKSEERAKPTATRSKPVEATSGAGRPSDELAGADRFAYFDAIHGVRPLRGKRGERAGARRRGLPVQPKPKPVPESPGDAAARARLAALVAGAVRFEVTWEDERVRGRRAGTPASLERELASRDVAVEATLDLHGYTTADAERAIVRFLRARARRGERRVAIVHGKGLHSEGGLGVLQDHTVRVLTEGGAAPVVRAFASAAPELGGSGALVVQLEP